jgi:hypothetical protein
MFKALSSLVIAGAGALAIASPASAAPVCSDGGADAYGSWGSFASTAIYASDYCTGDNLTITNVNWWPSGYLSYNGDNVFIDGIYYSQETFLITVTDGVDTASFYVTVTPHFS